MLISKFYICNRVSKKNEVFVQACTVKSNFSTSRIIGPPEFQLLDPEVNMLCNIECCGNKTHQIFANMMLF